MHVIDELRIYAIKLSVVW